MIKFIKKIILTFILIILILSSLMTYKGYTIYKEALENKPIEQMAEEIRSDTEHFTTYSSLPQNYINAVISVEDKSFFVHNGINLVSIGRALINDIKAGKYVEGGSTITQQLAKNEYFTQKKEMLRKVAEVFMAFEIEQEYTKEEIFELYVNSIYFGDGYYNIYDAAQGYFEKDVQELNLHECTLLAGIPNAPSVYAPTKNPELAKERQAQVLYKMVKYKYLTQEEADKVYEETL